MPSARCAVIGERTRHIHSRKRAIGCALHSSQRSCRFSRRTTRTGSWAAPSSLGCAGPDVGSVMVSKTEDVMSKKLIFGLAAVSAALVGAAGVVGATSPMPGGFARTEGAKIPTVFSILRRVTAALRLPIVTRDQLVTRGHADDKLEIADLFQAYMFFHDTHNGEAVASLFTPEGAMEHMWNNG